MRGVGGSYNVNVDIELARILSYLIRECEFLNLCYRGHYRGCFCIYQHWHQGAYIIANVNVYQPEGLGDKKRQILANVNCDWPQMVSGIELMSMTLKSAIHLLICVKFISSKICEIWYLESQHNVLQTPVMKGQKMISRKQLSQFLSMWNNISLGI